MFKFAEKHLARLVEWLFPRRADLYTVAHVEDEPPLIKLRIVYLIGQHGNEWMAAMACPCGCGHTIKLNLLAHESRPLWSVHSDWRKRATIVPSVWRNVGCLSHFIVRSGHIHWC